MLIDTQGIDLISTTDQMFYMAKILKTMFCRWGLKFKINVECSSATFADNCGLGQHGEYYWTGLDIDTVEPALLLQDLEKTQIRMEETKAVVNSPLPGSSSQWIAFISSIWPPTNAMLPAGCYIWFSEETAILLSESLEAPFTGSQGFSNRIISPVSCQQAMHHWLQQIARLGKMHILKCVILVDIAVLD